MVTTPALVDDAAADEDDDEEDDDCDPLPPPTLTPPPLPPPPAVVSLHLASLPTPVLLGGANRSTFLGCPNTPVNTMPSEGKGKSPRGR